MARFGDGAAPTELARRLDRLVSHRGAGGTRTVRMVLEALDGLAHPLPEALARALVRLAARTDPRGGLLRRTLLLLRELPGGVTDSVLWPALIDSVRRAGAGGATAARIREVSRSCGIPESATTYDALIYSLHGKQGSAAGRRLLDEARAAGVVASPKSHLQVLQQAAAEGDAVGAAAVLDSMARDGPPPPIDARAVVAAALTRSGNAAEARRLLEGAVRDAGGAGGVPRRAVGALISALAAERDSDAIRRVLREARTAGMQLTAVEVGAVVTRCAEDGREMEALAWVAELRDQWGVRAEESLFASVAYGAASRGAVGHVQRIRALAAAQGTRAGPQLLAAEMKAAAQAGDAHAAERVMAEARTMRVPLPDRAFASLYAALCAEGRQEAALAAFSRVLAHRDTPSSRARAWPILLDAGRRGDAGTVEAVRAAMPGGGPLTGAHWAAALEGAMRADRASFALLVAEQAEAEGVDLPASARGAVISATARARGLDAAWEQVAALLGPGDGASGLEVEEGRGESSGLALRSRALRALLRGLRDSASDQLEALSRAHTAGITPTARALAVVTEGAMRAKDARLADMVVGTVCDTYGMQPSREMLSHAALAHILAHSDADAVSAALRRLTEAGHAIPGRVYESLARAVAAATAPAEGADAVTAFAAHCRDNAVFLGPGVAAALGAAFLRGGGADALLPCAQLLPPLAYGAAEGTPAAGGPGTWPGAFRRSLRRTLAAAGAQKSVAEAVECAAAVARAGLLPPGHALAVAAEGAGAAVEDVGTVDRMAHAAAAADPALFEGVAAAPDVALARIGVLARCGQADAAEEAANELVAAGHTVLPNRTLEQLARAHSRAGDMESARAWIDQLTFDDEHDGAAE